MKLETFFEKFDLFTDAPDAVAKMRELVRHLAVTGKLVGQDPSDESGELLLKKINAERLAAVKARQISPMKPLPAVGDEELLFELQPGWAAARLTELVMEIQTGPFGSSLHKSDYQLGGTPVINPASLKDGKIVPIDEMAIGHATLKRLEVFKLNAGDIVMARRGEMGRCAIVTENEAGWLCGTGSLVLRMPRSLFAPYLAMLIGAPMARTYLGGASVGTTMQNLNQSILAKMPVGVPPLAEQKRIVAKVDELMALCDRLEAQQQERTTRHAALARASLARFADAPTPANLEYLFHSSFSIPPSDLRKSILTLAVQGKLVPQDPNDEPAEEIVSRIEAKSTDGAEAPVDETEMPWFLPSCWQWVRLGTIANIKHGYAFSSESFTSEPTRYVLTTPGNFYESGGFRDRGANTKYFNGDVPPAFVFNPRDLIIPMTEQAAGLLGSPAFIPDDGKTYLHNQRLGKLEFYSDEVAPEYVFWFFNSEFFRSELARTCTGMKVRHTSPKRILRVPFALPPLAEQRRIVAKVDELMALVDALETQLATARTTASRLLDAAVAELTLKGGRNAMNDPNELGMPLDGRWPVHGLTLEWFAEKAEWIGRDSHTPGSIDYFFDAAGRLLRYCGFDYMLLGPMCFHAIVGLEARLRFCFKADSNNKFNDLLSRAVDEKLVTDEAFSSPKPLPKDFLKKIGKPQPITHAGKLAVLLPRLRNDYFHGAFLLCPELLHLALEVREISDALTKAKPPRP